MHKKLIVFQNISNDCNSEEKRYISIGLSNCSPFCYNELSHLFKIRFVFHSRCFDFLPKRYYNIVIIPWDYIDMNSVITRHIYTIPGRCIALVIFARIVYLMSINLAFISIIAGELNARRVLSRWKVLSLILAYII